MGLIQCTQYTTGGGGRGWGWGRRRKWRYLLVKKRNLHILDLLLNLKKVRSEKDNDKLLCLYTPVSPRVPGTEGTYATGSILFCSPFSSEIVVMDTGL